MEFSKKPLNLKRYEKYGFWMSAVAEKEATQNGLGGFWLFIGKDR